MNTYLISYSFSGAGEATVKAKNEKEARKKFNNISDDIEFNDEIGFRNYHLMSITNQSN